MFGPQKLEGFGLCTALKHLTSTIDVKLTWELTLVRSMLVHGKLTFLPQI